MQEKEKARAVDTGAMVIAIVAKICSRGNDWYAVTYSDMGTGSLSKDTSVTFSRNAWTDNVRPEKGQYVFLEKVRRFVGGWRAMVAKPLVLNGRAEAERRTKENDRNFRRDNCRVP